MKSKVLHKFPLVYITWRDAESSVQWEEKSAVDKWSNEDYVVHDIGWLISKKGKYMVICSQVAEDGSLGNRTKIPKVWVNTMEYIGIAKRHAKRK